MNFEDLHPPGQVNYTKSGKKVKVVFPDKKEASVISPPLSKKLSKVSITPIFYKIDTILIPIIIEYHICHRSI